MVGCLDAHVRGDVDRAVHPPQLAPGAAETLPQARDPGHPTRDVRTQRLEIDRPVRPDESAGRQPCRHPDRADGVAVLDEQRGFVRVREPVRVVQL